MIIGQFIMIFLTHHNYVWHPESLYGVTWLQPTSKANGVNPGSRLRWSMPTWWTTPQSGNLASPYHDNSGLSWTVSALVKGIAVPVERHYTHWSVLLWWDPNDVPHRRILHSYEAERWSVPASLCWWWCYCLADQLWVLIAHARSRRL